VHTLSAAGSATIQRPITDFLSVQGTAAQGSFLAWASDRSTLANCSGSPFGFIDYAGIRNAFIIADGGQSLGTTMSGSVHQKDNGDGTSTVSVQLDTTNAMAVGACVDSFGNISTPYFGYGVADVLAGKPAALGTSHLSTVFTIAGTGPTAPLPDLLIFALGAPNCPAAPPCLNTLKFTGAATGALRAVYGVPEGTPGTMSISQIGTLRMTGRAATDGFTAEFVTIQPAK
jgi:hypothetical protein